MPKRARSEGAQIATSAADIAPTDPDGSSPISMRTVGSATAILGAGVLLGQLLGVLRTLFVANEIGVSGAFDAVLVALVVPTILGNWLSQALRVAIVPSYGHIVHRSGTAEARRFIGAVLTYLSLASLVAVALVIVLARPVIDLSGAGLEADLKELAVKQVPVLAPMLAFLALAHVLTAVCQIARQFVPIAATSVIGGLAGLVATVALWRDWGVTAYAIGTTLDAGVTLLILAGAAALRGNLPRPSLRADRQEVADFARHVLPMSIGSAVGQLNLLSDRVVATLIATGAASALKYGQQLVQAPAAAISTSWTTVIYPTVVTAGGVRAGRAMGDAMTVAIRYALVVFVPLAVGTIALAPAVVEIVYGRGAFGADSIRTTVAVMVGFAPMLALEMIRAVFVAAHQARRRGTLMAFNAICNATLNLVFNVLFGSLLGVGGIALSSSVTTAILLVFLATRVPRDEHFQAREVVGVAWRTVLASAVPGVLVGAVIWSLPPGGLEVKAVALVGGALTGLAGYLLMSRVLGVPEPLAMTRSVIGAFSRRFYRRARRRDGEARQ